MNPASAYVDRIVKLLSGNNRYKQMQGSFQVGQISLQFSFGTVLLGPQDEKEMVIIEDCESKSMQRIIIQLEALHAALSRAGSQRSISMILINPKPNTEIVEQIREMARVFELSSEDFQSESGLRKAMALFLPLPETSSGKMLDGEKLFLQNVHQEITKPLLGLVDAWSKPASQLEHQFLDIVENLISEREVNHD